MPPLEGSSPRPALIGLPFDAASTFLRGAAQAPPVIRDALHSSAGNLWSESGVDLGEPGALHDAGDLVLPGTEAARDLIQGAIEDLLRRGLVPLALGGDHSITLPILRALRPHHPTLTAVQLDAHPDLYESYEGDRYTHASPFARILEEGLIDRLVQMGIRAMNGHQRDQARRFGVEVIGMHDFAAGVRPDLEGPVYLSIDLDALDPAFAPGVSHREPGGLSAREVLTLIQDLPGQLVGADLVEFNPSRDPVGLTAPVCAKLVKELAGRISATGRPGSTGSHPA